MTQVVINACARRGCCAYLCKLFRSIIFFDITKQFALASANAACPSFPSKLLPSTHPRVPNTSDFSISHRFLPLSLSNLSFFTKFLSFSLFSFFLITIEIRTETRTRRDCKVGQQVVRERIGNVIRHFTAGTNHSKCYQRVREKSSVKHLPSQGKELSS